MAMNGDSPKDLMESYPTLKRKDVLACLEYAAYLAQEQVTPIKISLFNMKIFVDENIPRET